MYTCSLEFKNSNESPHRIHVIGTLEALTGVYYIAASMGAIVLILNCAWADQSSR